MNRKERYNKSGFYFVAMLLMGIVLSGCKNGIEDFIKEKRLASIFPDYTDVVLPPNIAPINFKINEKGDRYYIEIYSTKGNKIKIKQSSAKIDIPVDKWHELLNANKGNNLFIDIYVKKDRWVKYITIKDSIASEEIDHYMAYRLIYAVYLFWNKMQICQRNLENFDEEVIYENSSGNNNCVNCHSFCRNNPEKMSLHFRIIHPGTLIDDDGKLKFIDTKTPYTMSGCVYPSWHTDGNLIAYSLVRLEPETFSQNDKYVDVADEASDLVVYNIKTNILTTSPKISTENRENLPTWSPDGKWLYYISAPQYKASLNNLHRVKYDLVRIAYNAQSNTWGDVDTVLTSRQTGMSISFPLISPDGKYLMFCMTDYGYFTAYHKISDLYLLDLETHKYKKLNINSSSNESYHSWSSNGRWLVFGSKRLDDIYTRPFFTYFDKEGNTYKPFILPQKDPDIYTYLLANYNRSELITGKIEINRNAIRDLLFTKPVPVQFDTAIDIDALSGASKIKKQE